MSNSMPSLESNKSITSNSGNSRRSSISTGSNTSYGSNVWTSTNVSPNNLRRNQDFIELANLYRRYKIQYAALSAAHENANETLASLHEAVTGEAVRNYRAEMADVQAKITALLERLGITPEQLEADYLRLTTNLAPFNKGARNTRKGSVSGGRRKSRGRRRQRRHGGQRANNYVAQANSLIANLLATPVPEGAYTYIVWDEIQNHPASYLHAFIKNIPVGADGKIQLANGNPVVAYVPPTPPAGSGKHTYNFALYKQPLTVLNTPKENSIKNTNKRSGYNHTGRVSALQLTRVASRSLNIVA